MTNDQILEIRKKHFIGAALPYYRKPIQLVRAKGQYVYDESGKEYLDSIGGIVCISAGHNHPKIKELLLKMLSEDEIQHTTLLYLNRRNAELTSAILEEAPNHIDRAFFTNSGSEANELAFLAARQATGETVIVHLRHSYHGCTAGALSVCGHNTWKYRGQPAAAVTSAMEPYCYRCPFGKTQNTCALECAKNVETTIQTTTHGKIAAFIAEPVMGVGGFITPPNEYFHTVERIVHNYGGKYISDEVQTGAGRTGGSYLLTKEMGLKADAITMAKGFGNGAAIGGTLMTSEMGNAMSGKLFLNTFGGDPFQTAQAKATMEIIREEGLIQNAKEMGDYLRDGFTQMMKTHSLIGDVRGRGLMVGIELVRDRTTKEHATTEAADIMELCKDKGLLIGKGGLHGNVLRMTPPLSLSKKQCDVILRTLDESFTEVSRKTHAK